MIERTIRWRPKRAAKAWIFRLFLVPFVAIGVFLLLWVGKSLCTDWFGTNQKAVIVEHQKDDGGEGTTYQLKYLFEVNGKEISKFGDVSYDEYEALSNGDTVGIRFIAAYPEFTAKLSDPRIKKGSLFLIGMAVFWNLFLAVMVPRVWFAPFGKNEFDVESNACEEPYMC